ncbi:MAG: Gfo/Idh/MocA family oxidoreductase [Kiritimatiellae bacterium]|nr:Gfo/Idh/MocA family oxidoreductase [Kiritimatiellia bacterium]
MHTVAHLGLGNRGRAHADVFVRMSDRFRLVGLCDLDRAKLRAYAAEKGLASEMLYADVDTMLAKTRPDVFSFTTQPAVRLPLVELAVKHGVKGLALEKPMATSIQEAWAMTKLCRENGIKAVVSTQHKYLTSLQQLKALCDAGEIGQILQITTSSQAWMAHLGSHYVDYMLWANNGARAKWVVGHVHGRAYLQDSHPAPEYALGHAEFENGVRGFFQWGKLAPSYMPPTSLWIDNRLTVYGTHGHVWADTNGRWGAFTKSSNGACIGEEGEPWSRQADQRAQPLYARDFADWLDDDAKIHPCNIDLAYHGHEILEAVCISAMHQKRVDLPLDPDACEDILSVMREHLPDCPQRPGAAPAV